MVESKFKVGQLIILGEDIPKSDIIHFNNSKLALDIFKAGLIATRNVGGKVVILADVDFDGISSFYLMYRLISDEIGKHMILPSINVERIHGINDRFVDSINCINSIERKVPLVIIVDSSTNSIDKIRRLKCDVIVIDHHEVEIDNSELSGYTDGGRYVIVNNEVDHIPDMSCAEVIYEWIRSCGCEAWLESNKLQSWVAVSLFSDIIDADNIRNQWYIQQLVDKMQVETNLASMFKSAYKGSKFCKSDISFSLVPIVNATIRMGKSIDLLNYVISKPEKISELMINKTKQSEKRDFALANREGRLVEYPDVAYYCLDGLEGMDGFAGLVAIGLQTELKKSIFVYSSNEEGIHGSFRLTGVMTTYNFKGKLAEQEGMTASGHRDAFGFTVSGENAIERLVNKVMELNANFANSETQRESEVIVSVNSANEFMNLKFNGELNRIAMINARVTTTKQIFIKVPNNSTVVNVSYTKDNKLNVTVFGQKVTAYREFEKDKDYLYLYAEKVSYLNIYVDGVRP